MTDLYVQLCANAMHCNKSLKLLYSWRMASPINYRLLSAFCMCGRTCVELVRDQLGADLKDTLAPLKDGGLLLHKIFGVGK